VKTMLGRSLVAANTHIPVAAELVGTQQKKTQIQRAGFSC